MWGGVVWVCTYWWSGGSLLAGGSGGTHGHVSVERTDSGTGTFHRVGKGGHLLEDHTLADLDDVLCSKGRTLRKGKTHREGEIEREQASEKIITTYVTGSGPSLGHGTENSALNPRR